MNVSNKQKLVTKMEKENSFSYLIFGAAFRKTDVNNT